MRARTHTPVAGRLHVTQVAVTVAVMAVVAMMMWHMCDDVTHLNSRLRRSHSCGDGSGCGVECCKCKRLVKVVSVLVTESVPINNTPHSLRGAHFLRVFDESSRFQKFVACAIFRLRDLWCVKSDFISVFGYTLGFFFVLRDQSHTPCSTCSARFYSNFGRRGGGRFIQN